jgi:N6-adenosine-specific RNA methylase IME4
MGCTVKYNLIYADPPWEYRDKANAGQRGACHKYPVMSLADIMALDVPSIAAADCLLAMWWVSPQPREALAVVDAWGFELKQMCGFTWHKLSKTGRVDHFGSGHYTRSNTENVLFAVRGKFRRASASIRGMVTAPIARHSEKPTEVRERLEMLVGDVPRIELFARKVPPGWDVWGNEVDSSVALSCHAD